jgi:hypothetical protein
MSIRSPTTPVVPPRNPNRAYIVEIPDEEASEAWRSGDVEVAKVELLRMARNHAVRELQRGDVVVIYTEPDTEYASTAYHIFDGQQLDSVKSPEEIQEDDEPYGQIPEQFKVPSQFPPKYWSDVGLASNDIPINGQNFGRQLTVDDVFLLDTELNGTYLVLPVSANGKIYYYSTLMSDRDLGSANAYRDSLEYAQDLVNSVNTNVYAQWALESPFPGISSEEIIQIYVEA